jgi:NADPH:quinone reductase-like Zn-dependent oxidoreductase
MRAIVLEEHGTIDKLKVKISVELQTLKENEVRISVKYCGLNHLDLWLRKGGTGDRLTLPRIPGSDIAGIVGEVGSEVTHLKKGDTVLVYPGVGCGHCEACAKGKETQCHKFQIIGYHLDGGYGESIQVPARNALTIPNENLEQWAGVPISYVTAWNALVTKGKLHSNDTVAIWGASGGLGFAALSIAEGFGATVIAIVGSNDKKKFLLEQGFEGHIVVRSENLEAEIRELTGRRGVDLVLDHVGKQTWNQSLRMLARGGRLSFCGITTGPKVETDLRYIFGKQLSIFGSWMGDRSDLIEVIHFLKKTRKLPYIYKEIALEEAGEAQACMENGKHVGKIILKI